jgi:hypothetical protein
MTRLLLGSAALLLALNASNVLADDYIVLKRFHQTAATDREESDITVIRCTNGRSDGREYYIYGYYRNSGPNYRVIIPPYWGNPIGGKDHWSFEDAVAAACYQ